ncbi:hypothetical protein L7F22_042252 [Adiantum nelumboides]|nr:hypothetical protein [Adiantum nelumboides]
MTDDIQPRVEDINLSKKHTIQHTNDNDEQHRAKRVNVSNPTTEQDEQIDIVSEKDVGIIAYVNPDLVPIEGGIIKQRYSDFHVREVARGGQVCRITSLQPPKEEEGGGTLYALYKEQEAEKNDKSGQLKRSRLAKEDEEKRARQSQYQQEKQQTSEQTSVWNVNEEQNAKLLTLLGTDGLETLKSLWSQGAKPKQEGRDDRFVNTLPLSDKQQRTEAHQLVREAFNSLLLTEHTEVKAEDGSSQSAIRIRWGTGRPEQRRAPKQDKRESTNDDRAPPYIHFLMQKTNRDSQDALNILARSLGLLYGGGGGGKAVKDISVAGTKDKRGITVQQVALRRGRRTLDDLWRMANGLHRNVGKPDFRGKGQELINAVSRRGDRGIRIGHLRYADDHLHLGQLEGNEFEIVLRNVKVSDRSIVDAAMDVLKTRGFINYYGMQRFGTSTISTHKIGIALLKGDYKGAVELIMCSRQGDPENVQQAREAYQQGRFDDFLSLIPNFYVGERSIVSRMKADRHAFPKGQNPSSLNNIDWKKYFSALPRSLRVMYVHAFQSYIWNSIATRRAQDFGLQAPIIGDYVWLKGEENYVEVGVGDEEEDEDARLNAVVNGTATSNGFGRKQVKILENEAELSKYTIHDVMIPSPGSQVQIPETSWMFEPYQKILQEEGLRVEDLENAGKQSAELALTGDYRALLHLPKNVSYELVRYTDPNVNLVQSDEDKILGLETPPRPVGFDEPVDPTTPSFVALILRFTLGVSAYATMAIREILKQETSSNHQRELTMRGEDQVRK